MGTFDRNEETGQVCLNMWALNAVHATSRCPTTDGRLHLQWGTTVDKMMSKVDPDQLPNWNPERNDLASRIYAPTSAEVRVNTPGYEKGLFSPWTGCGYREAPGPFLADCEETLPENVPDIRGTWSVWVEEKQRY